MRTQAELPRPSDGREAAVSASSSSRLLSLRRTNGATGSSARSTVPRCSRRRCASSKGFQYAPDPEVFWIHGKSTESDFIYVTTQNLSRDQLRFISDQVGLRRTLLICCSAFRAKKDDFPNLTLKKIPQAVLSRCEWGRDDYSLNVAELAPVQVVEEAKADDGINGSANGDGKKPKAGGRRERFRHAGAPAVRWARQRREGQMNSAGEQHQRTSQPADSAARVARNPRPRDGDRPTSQERRRSGHALSHPLRVSVRRGLRASVPESVLRSCDRRRQDALDGGVHRLSLPRARHPALLRPRTEPDHLQQARHRLHAEHAEIRLSGHRRVRGEVAGARHRREFRAAAAGPRSLRA